MQAKARTRLRAVLAGLTPIDLNLGPLLTGAAQTKLSWAKLVESYDRVRGALLHTMATEGPRTLSQFINDAVMKEVTRLEKKHNAGKPFPKLGAGKLPQGRPLSD